MKGYLWSIKLSALRHAFIVSIKYLPSHATNPGDIKARGVSCVLDQPHWQLSSSNILKSVRQLPKLVLPFQACVIYSGLALLVETRDKAHSMKQLSTHYILLSSISSFSTYIDDHKALSRNTWSRSYGVIQKSGKISQDRGTNPYFMLKCQGLSNTDIKISWDNIMQENSI